MYKKVLIALVISMAFAISGFSQTAFTQTVSNPAGTVVNTGADTLLATIPGYWEVVSIQPVVTKVSGTVVGYAILQVSVNGFDFVAPFGDSLTLANVTARQAPIFTFQKPGYRFYRIITTGTGTMSATVSATFNALKNY